MRATRLVGWFADPVISYVDGIVAAGANSVSMGPYYVMNHWNDSDVGETAGTVETHLKAAQYARSRGLQVVWKPIIDCNNYDGNPYGAGFRGYILPADIELWFKDYIAKCWQPFIDLMDVAAVHTELGTISRSYGESFIELISWLRTSGFAGPVTTSADFDPLACPYWACLDWIGGDAYPAIRSESLSGAIEDWTAVAQEAAVAHTQTGCDVYFGELAANAGVAVSPAGIQLVYQAFWEVFGPLDWWAGFSYWRWPQDSTIPSASLTSTLAGGLGTYPDYDGPSADAYEAPYFVGS